MKKIHKTWIQSIGVLTFLFLLNSCDNTEAYYDQLLDLPQLDLTDQYAYKSAYNIGDTLWMYGAFQQPQNKLTVTIGDAEADIVKKEKVTIGVIPADKIGMVITEDMGIGNLRSVVLTSGTRSINCPEIDIRGSLAPYAFPDDAIELYQYAKVPSTAVFAQCTSGTGNLFYYNADGSFYCMKDGTASPILSAAELKAALGSTFTIATMYSVAVDAAEKHIYCSVRSLVGSTIGYQLLRADLETKEVAVLNDKPSKNGTLGGTYKDGDVAGTLNMVLSEVYPDNEGNIYAIVAQSMSGTTVTKAGAIMIGTDNKIKCLYTLNANTSLQTQNKGYDYPVYIPEEQRVLFKSESVLESGTILQYALPSMQKTREVAPSSVTDAPYIGEFGDIKLPPISTAGYTIAFGTEKIVTYVPQSYGVTMNIYVTDFDNSRVVAYAKNFSIGSYTPTKLLGYDAEGHLYFTTSNGAILKTKIATK